MKRYLNYLLLASNVIVTIFIAAMLGIFLKSLNNSNNTSLASVYSELSSTTWIVIAVLVFIISFGLFVLYIFLIKKTVKESTEKINPRLINGLLYSGLLALVNYTVPFTLFFVGTYYQNYETTLWFLSFAFGISALIGLIIAGFTSFFNLRISWSSVRREQLKLEALQENESKQEEESEQYKKPNRNTAKLDKDLKKPEPEKDSKKIDEPTSGSF